MERLRAIFNLNKVIRSFIFADLFLNFGFGLSGPVFAIFIIKNIHGGDVKVAGIAAGVYWIFKAMLQMPISLLLDRWDGEKDDYWFLVAGYFLTGFVPLGYIFTSEPWHLYFWQGFLALAMSMAVPAWAGIFSRHLNRGREAFSWGLESSSLSIAAGISGIIGGVVAKSYGFLALFVGVSVFNFISALVLLLAKNEVLPKEKPTVRPVKPDHLR